MAHWVIAVANCYDQIHSFEHLYNAYRLAARAKHDRDEIVTFELKLARNLWKLHDELKNEHIRSEDIIGSLSMIRKHERYRRFHSGTGLFSTAYATTC